MRLLGYARVSTATQDTGMQLTALRNAGCEQIYQDKAISGGKRDRPGLNQMLADLRQGDVVVAWALDRLARSLKDLLEIVDKIEDRGAGFRLIKDPSIDTTTPAGRLVFQVMGAIAEFERGIIRQRLAAGYENARKTRGMKPGRKKVKRDRDVMAYVYTATKQGISTERIARVVGVSPRTINRIRQELDSGAAGQAASGTSWNSSPES